MIGRFDPGRRLGGLLRPMVKQRVGQRPTDTLVKEHEHGGDALAFYFICLDFRPARGIETDRVSIGSEQAGAGLAAGQ